MAGGHRARRAGPQLAHPVGLDHGEQLRPVGREERDEEARPLGEADVGLQTGNTELEVGGCQHVEQALGHTEPKARTVLDRPARDAREAPFDGLDGVLRREELLDVGFAEIERHGAG
jgi:hypothetical protein